MSLDDNYKQGSVTNVPPTGTYQYGPAASTQASIERLMVIVDFDFDLSGLLQHAAKLKAQYQCKIFLVTLKRERTDQTNGESSIDALYQKLDVASMPYFTAADRVDTSVINCNSYNNDDSVRVVEPISEFVCNHQIDMVLKTSCSPNQCNPELTDRMLIHALNCNLLFIPDKLHEQSTIVVAAIDVTDEHENQKALNQLVAGWTKSLSNSFSCTVTAVSVVDIEMALQMLDETGTSGSEPFAKAALKKKIQNLLDQHRIQPAKVVISAGDPAKKILNNAHNQNARLVVIGSTERDIQAPMFNGNTAEKVLLQLQAPLLVVKNCEPTYSNYPIAT